MSPENRTSAPHLPLVDLIKAVASQLIVLHHLAFYGPMSDAAMELMPGVLSWLSQQGRLAVQAFLVVGGFLAAMSLAPRGTLASPKPLALIGARYLRLVLPYLAALIVAVIGTALARALLLHDSQPGAPTLVQFAAHLLFLQGLLGQDALVAGAWYVAMDFQLYALLVGLLWLARGAHRPPIAHSVLAGLVIGAVGTVSLLHFNRDAGWDNWALYFFGAYSMGALAYWGSDKARSPAWLVSLAALAILALVMDFRPRIAVAASIAVALGTARRSGFSTRLAEHPLAVRLSRLSYSLFLVHFPVCLIINAAVARIAPGSAWFNGLGMLAAWMASLIAAHAFHCYVEGPARVLHRPLVNSLRGAWGYALPPWRSQRATSSAK